MKFFEEICFHQTRPRNDIFVIVKTIDVAIVFCRHSPTFVLERLLSCVKIALIANTVFSKSCPEVFIQVL